MLNFQTPRAKAILWIIILLCYYYYYRECHNTNNVITFHKSSSIKCCQLSRPLYVWVYPFILYFSDCSECDCFPALFVCASSARCRRALFSSMTTLEPSTNSSLDRSGSLRCGSATLSYFHFYLILNNYIF